jgi:hypothetical protein
MTISDKNDEECDATGDDSSNYDGYINTGIKNTFFVILF